MCFQEQGGSKQKAEVKNPLEWKREAVDNNPKINSTTKAFLCAEFSRFSTKFRHFFSKREPRDLSDAQLLQPRKQFLLSVPDQKMGRILAKFAGICGILADFMLAVRT